MEFKYNTYEMQRVNINDKVINLPEETFCFQEWNYRTQYLVKPKFTTWEAEPKVWEYQILVLHTDRIRIEKTFLRLSDIEQILNRDSKQQKNWEEIIQFHVLHYINNFFGDDMLSIEKFKESYNYVNAKIEEEFNLTN